jgi:hypothetical protein
MYKIYNEYAELTRIVKYKVEADHFVNDYGWSAKFFKDPKKQEINQILLNAEEAPF